MRGYRLKMRKRNDRREVPGRVGRVWGGRPKAGLRVLTGRCRIATGKACAPLSLRPGAAHRQQPAAPEPERPRGDIVNAFRQEGWKVLEAATGVAVLELLREACSIDLLVTDIGLGDDTITGWDVAEAVRTKHAEVPVIYASGGPDNEGRRVPKSVFLCKPVDTNELMLTCSKLRSTGR
jgi:CheY-like chemotaxis protein